MDAQNDRIEHENRTEYDTVGEMRVPADAYYGVQTLRAVENFPMTGKQMDREMIFYFAAVKKAAAQINEESGHLNPKIAGAIRAACDEIMAGNLHEAFVVDPIQGGAGTSANMNANEVIANRAIELLGGKKGDYHVVHPNDHVNMGQSTNDMYPSAAKLAAIHKTDEAIKSVKKLILALEEKAEKFDKIIKMGRTQLQDAVPIRMGQEFEAYAAALKRDVARIEKTKEGLMVLNLGATAIGTGITASAYYIEHIVPQVAKITGFPVVQADNLIDATQNIDGLLALSGMVKVCAMNMSKIANDLRLLSSGPRTGIGEILLPPMQNGSSIMPGKVNPVIPEVVTQAAFRIGGNDVTITMCLEGGQLELNPFEPVLFYSLYESLQLLKQAAYTFRVHCIEGLKANEKRCEELVQNSFGMVTALTPYIGYEKAAQLIRGSEEKGISVLEYARQNLNLPKEELDEMIDLYGMTQLPKK